MSRDIKAGLIEFGGIVTEILGGGSYRITSTNGHEIIAYSSGKIKKNKIKIVVGDSVKVEASVSDPYNGRITLRCK